MRALTVALLFSITLNAFGQMPYNPDSNGDYLIGAPDLLTFLGVYNTMLIDSSLMCDYQGTELEELFSGIFSQTLILDSVYVEYLLVDTSITYLPGCPDPVELETILDRSYIMGNFQINFSESYFITASIYEYIGYSRYAHFVYHPDSGAYFFSVQDNEIGVLTSYSSGSQWIFNGETYTHHPFPESWTINEDGFQVDWKPEDWVANCSHFRLIPYWHEAE